VVDAAAPRAVRDDSKLPAEPTAISVVRSLPATHRLYLVLWLLIVGGMAVFLVAGTIRVGAGGWIGRRLPVRVIWSDFLGWLADQGASPLLVVAITAAAALSLALAAGTLWLAFTLRDATAEDAAEDSSGHRFES
jgi:hypothetical protein